MISRHCGIVPRAVVFVLEYRQLETVIPEAFCRTIQKSFNTDLAGADTNLKYTNTVQSKT